MRLVLQILNIRLQLINFNTQLLLKFLRLRIYLLFILILGRFLQHLDLPISFLLQLLYSGNCAAFGIGNYLSFWEGKFRVWWFELVSFFELVLHVGVKSFEIWHWPFLRVKIREKLDHLVLTLVIKRSFNIVVLIIIGDFLNIFYLLRSNVFS